MQRLGSSESVRVDVRVVAATNADLANSVEQNRFREDLYYRLSAFPLELPPLAERKEDVLLLAQHFLRLNAAAAKSVPPALTAHACRILEAHGWKGNVRELHQMIERAEILSEGSGQILPEHLCFHAAGRAIPFAEKSAEPRAV